jgi:dTDP-4-amino-4,6-dideoxygalactose transaminase
MSSWKVPLSDVIVTEQEIAAVADVYRSGWLSLGPRTAAFEEQLAAYAGVEHAVAVANGTAALHLMCLAVGLGPGDEVIVPSMTFVATVNAVAYTGARPVFADIVSVLEPWLDPASVEELITPRTKAVMMMSYGGHCGETERLAEICAERELMLLEDAAHGLGSRLHGRQLGTFGAVGAYSFFSNKNLAVGEGGAAVTSDPEIAERLRLLRSHGMTSLSWDRHKGHATGYDVVALGYNYRIDEPRAALASARLKDLDEQDAQRAELVSNYRAALGELGLAVPLAPRDGLESAHHLACMLLEPGVDRVRFRDALAAAGVQTSMHYPPVHRFSIYATGAPDLPVTDEYASRTVTLPLFAHMTADQLDVVISAVDSALTRSGV